MDKRDRYYIDDDDDVPDHIKGRDEEPDEEYQEGGWKGKGSRSLGLRGPDYYGYAARLARAGKNRVRGIHKKDDPFRSAGKSKVKASDSSTRTFRAIVDGERLMGKHYPEGATTKAGIPLPHGTGPNPTRYFHGATALRAARKVIGSMYKREELEAGQPVSIRMIEVTKGYSPAKGGHFEYEYFGMRDDTFRGMMIRDGKKIKVNGQNVAVPARGKASFEEAMAASKAKGKKVMAAKGLAIKSEPKPAPYPGQQGGEDYEEW